MDITRYLKNESEKPLDNIAEHGGMCRIFKKIACIGDSLSSGEFQIRNEDGSFDYYDMYEYSWGQYIARMTGSMVFNFSKGGMSSKWYMESFAEEMGYFDKESACQAYIIALGANDLRVCELGTTDDIDLTDYRNNRPTFAGYYGQIVQRYKEIQPRAKFFFVTLPKDNTYPHNRDHRDLLEEMTHIFDNAYLIDLNTYAPEYNEEIKKQFFMHDHMNPAGYVFTADMIMSYIDYIVRYNFRDFDEVGFIGTQTTNK